MRLISFDPYRTLGMKGVTYIKPDQMYQQVDQILAADWLLFPEYWQINSLAYGLGQRIFPSVASYHLGHNKIEMTRCFQLISPANVPQTLILANTPGAQQQILEQFDFPFVAKFVKSARGEGVFLIEGPNDFLRYCDQAEVLYVQERLPIDRDLRLILIGQKVVAGYWRVAGQGSFYNNLSQGGELVYGLLPQVAVELVETLAHRTGINHAGFDIAMVDGHPYILEFNRLFGNQGWQRAGLNLIELIEEQLKRAPIADISSEDLAV